MPQIKPHLIVVEIEPINSVIALEATCPECGGAEEFKLPLHQFHKWRAGTCIQDAFPDMPPEKREQLITGICPKCWDDMFKPR